MDTVSLDLESTGVYPPTDAILEMAMVDHDEYVLLHTLVRPVRHTAEPEAEAIHGMTSHDVQCAPILDTFQQAATPPTPLQRWAPQLLDGAGEPGQATPPRTSPVAINGAAPCCEVPPAPLELRTNAWVLVVTRGSACTALLPGRRLTAPGGRGLP